MKFLKITISVSILGALWFWYSSGHTLNGALKNIEKKRSEATLSLPNRKTPPEDVIRQIHEFFLPQRKLLIKNLIRINEINANNYTTLPVKIVKEIKEIIVIAKVNTSAQKIRDHYIKDKKEGIQVLRKKGYNSEKLNEIDTMNEEHIKRVANAFEESAFALETITMYLEQVEKHTKFYKDAPLTPKEAAEALKTELIEILQKDFPSIYDDFNKMASKTTVKEDDWELEELKKAAEGE